MADIVELAGLLIVLAAVVQAVIGVSSGMIRASTQRRRGAVELESLKERAGILLERATTERNRTELSWNGKRKFRVDRREYENQAKDICSFYLVPHDNRPVPPYRAGQFLTFELPIPDQPQPVVRCYSLSDSAHADHYRVTIKRLGPPPDAPEGTPPGLSSNYFHDQLKVGNIVEATAPAGEFFLNEESERPIVLICGGVGLTPMVSMLNKAVEHGDNREIWLFYGVRDRSEHAMYDDLKKVEAEHPNVHVTTCYSKPTETCRLDTDYSHKGFVSCELFKSLLPSNNYEYYICGPPPMMEAVTRDLEEWGVPEEDIRFEAFGPATVKRTSVSAAPADGEAAIEVVFARSKQTLQWSSAAGTLLDLGEANGIKINVGCRSGGCGSCLTALKEGDVEYIHRPGKKPEAGSCLVCIAQPAGPIVLDA